MTISSGRNYRLDGLKFCLICLVMLGHISYYDYGLKIDRLTYSFHMPLFVMISGYFTHHQTNRHFVKSILKLLGLYIIFQTFHVMYYSLAEGQLVSINSYLDPSLALWYLLCLIYWRCAYHFLKATRIKLHQCFAISILLSVISGYVPLGNDFLAFQRAFSFLPFFLFGMMMRNENTRRAVMEIKSSIVLPLLILSLAFSIFLPHFMPRSPYQLWYEPILRLVQSLLAFVICIGILRYFPKRIPKLFCTLGQWTLYYYLYHTIFVRYLSHILNDYHVRLNVIEAVICVALMVIIITMMRRIRFFRLLVLER